MRWISARYKFLSVLQWRGAFKLVCDIIPHISHEVVILENRPCHVE